jgi:TQXA domain-containing protein
MTHVNVVAGFAVRDSILGEGKTSVFTGGKLATLRRAGTMILAGAVIGISAATPALAADPVVARPSTGDAYGAVRLDGVVGPVALVPVQLTFAGGEQPLAYRLDLRHPVAVNHNYAAGTWADSEVDNLAKVQWVLLHGHPAVSADDLLAAAGTSAAGIRPKRIEAVLYSATQLAVWHFSDGTDLTANSIFLPAEFRAIQAVYTYLIGNATDLLEPAAELSISPATAADVEQGAKAGPFTVTGPSGDISLTVDGGTAVDADGNPVTAVVNGGRFFLTRDTPGDVTVSARAAATQSTGRVFLFRGPQDIRKQSLILAGTAGEPLTASAKAAFTPKPGSTPTPTPTATPSPTGTATPPAGPGAPGTGGGNGGALPTTWTSIVGPLVGGVVLLAAGIAAVILVRRRRVRFTA